MKAFKLNVDVMISTRDRLKELQEVRLQQNGKRKPSMGDLVDEAVEALFKKEVIHHA